MFIISLTVWRLCTWLAQRSAGFVGWTVFLTICGIGDAVYVYYLAVTRSYEVVEGTVSEIHAELFLMALRGL